MQRACAICSTLFEVYHYTNKCCSDSCKELYRLKRHSFNCITCNKEFTGSCKIRKYCSRDCANSAPTRIIPEPKIVLVCIDCKSAIKAKVYRKVKRCAACRYKIKGIKEKLRYKKLPKYARRPKYTCVVCNEIFKSDRLQFRRPQCKECRRKRSYRNQLNRGRIKNPGVGVGGNPPTHGHLRGPAHPRYNPDSPYHGKDVKGYTKAYRKKCFKCYPKKCVVCSKTKHIQVHHINAVRDDCRPTNLVPLCRKCHGKVHRGKPRKPEDYINNLKAMWPAYDSKIAEIEMRCRLKIAETNEKLSRILETTRSEVSPSQELQVQSIGTETLT